MFDITRGLYPYAVTRNSVELVKLVILSQTLNRKGFYAAEKTQPEKKARVVGLTQSEINRLLAAGVTINQGFNVSIPEEVPKVPDQVIRADGTYLKVVKYAISEGVSVFICDAAPLGPSEGFTP